MKFSSLALMALLGGCAATGFGPVITHQFVDPQYAAYGDRPFPDGMPTVILGAPPGGSAADVLPVVRAPSHLGGGPARPAEAGELTRVVISFTGGSPTSLCRRTPSAATLTAQGASAAYCVGDEAVTGAVLQRLSGSGPADPAFQSDVNALVRATTPILGPRFYRVPRG